MQISQSPQDRCWKPKSLTSSNMKMPIFELIWHHGEYWCGGENSSFETHQHQLSQALCRDLPSLTHHIREMPPFQSPWCSGVYWWIVIICICKTCSPQSDQVFCWNNSPQTCTIIESPILNYPHLTFDTNNSYIPRNFPLYPGVIEIISIICFFIEIHGCMCLLIKLCGLVKMKLTRCDGMEVCGCGG